MTKKLLVFSLIVLFLVGFMTFARVDNVITKSRESELRTAQAEKISKIDLPGSLAVSKSLKIVEKPVVQINAATAIDPEGDVIPVSIDRAPKPDLLKKHGYLYPGDSQIVPLEKTTEALPHGYLFNYDDEQTEYYLSGGAAGDEWGI